MPRQRKPPRLYLRKDGDQWIIRDGGRDTRTGCRGSQLAEAERALQSYLREKPVSGRRAAVPHAVTVGEVLAKYADDIGPTLKSKGTLVYSIKALARFWADLSCADVVGDNCRLYARRRTVENGTIRRELGVLQSALNHAHKEGLIDTGITVTLPPSPAPRDRWLTVKEAASLVRAAPPHLRRFILLSLYTGRRLTAVLELTWDRVDLVRNVIRFNPVDRHETKKRRGQVQMPRQLRGHLARWKRLSPEGFGHVVTFKGKPVASIKTAFHASRIAAGLGKDVTPHTLKHTAITWALQNGLMLHEAAEYFDTSVETLDRYWHHSPHHQAKGRNAMEKRVSVRESVRTGEGR